jgi:hypothetical protein
VTDWTTLRYVVVDVEGNGQQPPELVELAVVPITGGIAGEPSSWLVKPEHPIKHIATTIHGGRASRGRDAHAQGRVEGLQGRGLPDGVWPVEGALPPVAELVDGVTVAGKQ